MREYHEQHQPRYHNNSGGGNGNRAHQRGTRTIARKFCYAALQDAPWKAPTLSSTAATPGMVAPPFEHRKWRLGIWQKILLIITENAFARILAKRIMMME